MTKHLHFLLAVLVMSIAVVHAQKAQRVKAVGFGKNISGVPLELVKVPEGTYAWNYNNISGLGESGSRRVLVSSFYMSTREVTNMQYKEFTDWVRDSIAAYLLGGIYLTVDKKTGVTSINWATASKIDFNDAKNQQKLAPMMLDASQTLSHHPEVNPDKLIYEVQGIDYQEAAKLENKGRNPNDFIYKYDINIYPDTLVWIRDFGYSNNEQMALGYYSGDQYKNYPVVGINWMQASAYCDWFTKQKMNREQAQKKLAVGGLCRLPTETEWAYAANLNEDNSTLADNGKSDAATISSTSSSQDTLVYSTQLGTTKQHKSFWASIGNFFRNNRPKYQQQPQPPQPVAVAVVNNKAEVDENAFLPINTMGRKIGKYGLSGMSDNVSEWTGTSYYEGGTNFENRFNPDIQWGTIHSESKYQRRRVVRGGSWKDIPRYNTINNRFYGDIYDDHSYIGFRIVVINLPE